jgi:MFS family permease
VIVAGLCLCSAMVGVLARTTAPWTVTLVVVAYAAGVATTTAATSAFITDLTRRERYGAAHGVFGTIYDIGDALGPIAAGVLIAAAGYGAAFSVLAVVGASMAGLFAVASRPSPVAA